MYTIVRIDSENFQKSSRVGQKFNVEFKKLGFPHFGFDASETPRIPAGNCPFQTGKV